MMYVYPVVSESSEGLIYPCVVSILCVRWPYAVSSSLRGKEIYKTLMTSDSRQHLEAGRVYSKARVFLCLL